MAPYEQRNPLSYGTGKLIAQVLEKGAKNIAISIGGSATNDAGMGMMQALGVRFLDNQGHELSAGGGSLIYLYHIDINGLNPHLVNCSVRVACDVPHPLIGRSYIYKIHFIDISSES